MALVVVGWPCSPPKRATENPEAAASRGDECPGKHEPARDHPCNARRATAIGSYAEPLTT